MAVNLSRLSFASRSRYQYVALKGSSGFSIAGGGFSNTTVTIPHALGYKPYYRLRYSFGVGRYFSAFAGTGSFNIAGNSVQLSNISVTSTALVLLFENFGVPAVNGTVYYRIYAEALA